jgi:RHS repeat-associated protein
MLNRKKHWLFTSAVAATLTLFANVANAAPEICGNGIDDDGDNLADEGCYPTLTTGVCESPLSCGLTGAVSPTTGSLRYSLAPDLAPSVPYGPGIGFRRFYTSQYAPGAAAPAYRKALGDRWQHTYSTWIDKVATPTPARLFFHTNLGQDVLWTYSTTTGGQDYYTPQAGFHAQYLRQSTVNSEYELKLLTGEVLNFTSAGRLFGVKDTIGNGVTLAYDVNNQLSTVTDAAGTRRLLFAYTAGLMISATFQILIASVWTNEHAATYVYTASNLTSVFLASQKIHTNTYVANYLTQVQDNYGNNLITFSYDSATPGKVVRIDTPRGVLGYEFASTRTSCTGKTALYFNRGNATACNIDGDCGAGFLCGGKTGTGATGICFRGARCLTTASLSEDVITAVTSFGPPSETCDGACLEATQYSWNTGSGALDLGAIQDPSGNYTVRAFNSKGLPTSIVYGDPDTNATNGNGKREANFFYDPAFPGKIAEIRRDSDVVGVSKCLGLGGNIGSCARNVMTYNAAGLLASSTKIGWTLNTAGIATAYSLATSYTYDSVGRLTQVDGALPGSNDVTVFEYWTSSDVFKQGRLQNYKRKKDATTFLTLTAQTYDFWGNATAVTDVDGSLSCATYNIARGDLQSRREAMAGQTTCTANAADLVTSYTRDLSLRLTSVQRPGGQCVFYDYDSRGRLAHVLRRDSCTTSIPGDTQTFTYSTDGQLSKTEIADAANVVTWRQEMTYFDSRRLEKVINPVDVTKWTGLTYDSRGLVTEVAGAGGLSKSAWDYNAEGRVTAEKRYTTSSAFDTWNTLFDWNGNSSQVTDGDAKVIQSVRDDLGRMVKKVSPDLGGFPTLNGFDERSRLTTMIESFGGAGQMTHTFTYDNLGRYLTGTYANGCVGATNPDISTSFDVLPSGVTCPVGVGCARTTGRVAYIKTRLMCDAAQADKSLDQETFFSYDDAGRLIREYIRDDSGRIASQSYTWTQNGELATTTLPSTNITGWAYGTSSNSSDTDRVSAIWRNTGGGTIIDVVRWYPFGPVQQYNQQNTSGGIPLRTRITRNLAYRITGVFDNEPQTGGGAALHSVAVTEDAKGRVTSRDYTPSNPAIAGLYDSFFLYDQQDRVLCETTTSATVCPVSGSTVKNTHSWSPPFTAAGDWKTLQRPWAGTTGLEFVFNTDGYGPSHQVTSVTQLTGSPALGITNLAYDTRGDRKFDDNVTTQTNDRRDYTYDGRGNLVNVRGQYKKAGTWRYYDVVSAFDARNRRVFKSFFDETDVKTAQWFFYYDARDRLSEVRYTPNTTVPADTTTFQLYWLEGRMVMYYQTDVIAGVTTVTKRYVGLDESGRPVDMVCWGAGDCPRVWSINPSAWGNDTVLVGAGVYQPLLFPGQYRDDETAAWMNDGVTAARPALAWNHARTYDPFTGGYLQVDPLLPQTWSGYGYARSNPVGAIDLTGEAAKFCMLVPSSVVFDGPDPEFPDAIQIAVVAKNAGIKLRQVVTVTQIKT